MFKRLSAAALFAGSMLVAACQQPAETGTQAAQADCVTPTGEEGAVNLYTARHYASDDAIYAAFTCATGIRVQKIEIPAEQMLARLQAEGAGSPADVIVIQDAGAMGTLAEGGVLTAFDDAVKAGQDRERPRSMRGRTSRTPSSTPTTAASRRTGRACANPATCWFSIRARSSSST